MTIEMYRTGTEPNHKVGLNIHHISHVQPEGKQWTWIHMVNGDKFMIDGPYNDVIEELNRAYRDAP